MILKIFMTLSMLFVNGRLRMWHSRYGKIVMTNGKLDMMNKIAAIGLRMRRTKL